MSGYKVPQIREGVFKAFYDHASNRVHKKFPHEGVFEIIRNEDGRLIGRLRDEYGNVIFADGYMLYRDIHHKLFDQKGFTFDNWDIRCEEETADDNLISASGKIPSKSPTMRREFTPASRMHPYGLVRKSPKLSTPLIRNLESIKSEDGFFVTYTQRMRIWDSQILKNLDQVEEESRFIQCQQCFTLVDINSHGHWGECGNPSQTEERIDRDTKESLFWNFSVASKAVIPKARLVELLQEYPNDNAYLAGIFDGFILGGHRLIGLRDSEFDEVVKNMRQL